MKKIELTAHPRSCIARRIHRFDREDVKDRLYSGAAQGGFRLISSNDQPSNEAWFDVAISPRWLHISVMAPLAANRGLMLDGFKMDEDVVEVFIDPFCDRNGYLQFAAGSDGMRQENSHWPYRDSNRNRQRDASWDVEVEEEEQQPDIVRFYFFRVHALVAASRACIGLNVCRDQPLISESSSWNLSSGIGFCDPGCFGTLWLSRPRFSCKTAFLVLDRSRLCSVSISGLERRGRNVRVRVELLSPSGERIFSWARMDTGCDRVVFRRGLSVALGLSREIALHLPGFLEPSFPEVRAFWMDKLMRGIRAGADRVCIRIAHHVDCVDWLAYAFADPVIQAFKKETGRMPGMNASDCALIRRIRGAFYTQFVREASLAVRKARELFIHHVENRMLATAEHDTYCQIEWDWRTWIREGLLDEIDLKYIGPDHPDCYREIMPLARQHGVKVNWITAAPEPRSKPRSIHESPRLLERAFGTGLDGMNLYELWLYRRMTNRGHPMTRGSGEAILLELKAAQDRL